MPNSQLSRDRIRPGTVIYHRDFEGFAETKDRYFIVIAATPTDFVCFTTSTSSKVFTNPKLRHNVTDIIPTSRECFRKPCFVDCRELHYFDDIVMSSFLNSGKVTIEGVLSTATVAAIYVTVRSSLALNNREKDLVSSALKGLLKNHEP